MSHQGGSKIVGADAPRGNTRSHPEHDGEDPGGRWYYAGDGMEEQEAARHFFINNGHLIRDEKAGASFPVSDG